MQYTFTVTHFFAFVSTKSAIHVISGNWPEVGICFIPGGLKRVSNQRINVHFSYHLMWQPVGNRN